MEKIAGFLLLFGLAMLIGLANATIGAVFFTPLWNWLMPYLFNLPTISFWQSIGLLFMLNVMTTAADLKSHKEN